MSVRLVEKIILELFRDEPFHNLYQYYQRPFPKHSLHKGGTCSIKSLSARRRLQDLKARHITAQLHQGIVHFNQKSFDHRLLKITIGGKIYFADVGNGWPTIKLFPADTAIKVNCYGIEYYSKICKDHLKIYQTHNDVSSHIQTIPFFCLSELHIRQQIKQVFHENRAPNKEWRFAQIIGNQFLFLRGNKLQIYGGGGKQQLDVAQQPLATILQEYFNFDLESFLSDE